MIVFKKITFLDSKEELDKKFGKLLNSNFYDEEDDIENVFSINPKVSDFLTISQEIEEYAFEFKDKKGALIVTRKEIWEKFLSIIYTVNVRFVEEDIQDLFFTKELENEVFETNANIYMLKHMSVDEVLDKMNKYGKKYLTDIDYEILKKAKNLS